MKTKIHYALLLILFVLSVAALQSFNVKSDEDDAIEGVWENYTIVKDENGIDRKKDGKYIYRKIKLTFNIHDLKYVGMQMVESYGFKEKRYKDKDKEAVMNYGLQTVFRNSYGQYDWKENSLDLKMTCIAVKVLDQKTDTYTEFKEGTPNFAAFQKLLDRVTMKKITKKQLTLEWDFNMDGKIDTDETMVFDSIE
jgi:hypothetical protein